MLATHLGAYGHTVLPAHEIKLMARDALRSNSAQQSQIDVFYMDTPHSGGTSKQVTVTFENIENDSLLFGTDDEGYKIVFFVNNPIRPATFVTQKRNEELAA